MCKIKHWQAISDSQRAMVYLRDDRVALSWKEPTQLPLKAHVLRKQDSQVNAVSWKEPTQCLTAAGPATPLRDRGCYGPTGG